MARRPGPSFRALLFRCGEGAVCEPSRLEDRQLRELVFWSVQKATLGTGGRGPQARSVPQGPAVSVWRRRRLWAFAAGRQTAQRASFHVGSESNVRSWGPWYRRPGPSFRALLFRCGEGAVCEPSRLEDRQLRELVFLSAQRSNVRSWGPWPAGPVRPSGPCCFGVAKAPFVSFRGWKTDSSES